MAIDLYGDTYVDNWDYARKIVTLGTKLPFLRAISFRNDDGGCSLSFYLEDKSLIEVSGSEFDCPGLYAIFEKSNGKFSCLYSGRSDNSMRQRVYRFMKELHGVSREDENHPAGKKARRANINPKSLYVKFFPQSNFPVMENARIQYSFLDETVAILLKSRFNVRKKC